jgi:hypothetical protein
MKWAGHAFKILIRKPEELRESGRCGMGDVMMKLMLQNRSVRR